MAPAIGAQAKGPDKDLEDAVGKPAVARSIGHVKAAQVAGEDANERPNLVGVLQGEIRVSQECVHPRQAVSSVGHSLRQGWHSGWRQDYSIITRCYLRVANQHAHLG